MIPTHGVDSGNMKLKRFYWSLITTQGDNKLFALLKKKKKQTKLYLMVISLMAAEECGYDFTFFILKLFF